MKPFGHCRLTTGKQTFFPFLDGNFWSVTPLHHPPLQTSLLIKLDISAAVSEFKKKPHFWNIKRNPEVSAPAVTSCHQQWLTDQGSQRAVGDGWGELDNDEVLVLSELLDLHTLLRHHVQLLQGVGLLRVPNRSDHIWSKTGNKIGQCLIKLPLNNN